MNHNLKLKDEGGRLAALERYEVLDTEREEAFDKLTELVRSVLGVPMAAVSLIDAERQWFKSIAGLDACETSRDISFCAHAIKQHGPMVVPDATLDVRFARNPLVTGAPRIRSYLGAPLTTPDGYNIGTLCAIDTSPRTFTSYDISILTSFAKLVLNELELRQIAMSDSLTGAMTRRAWIRAAKQEIARHNRHGTAASVILFDIDHFKKINDTQGHPAGDAILQALTQNARETLREGDQLGRLGGEEFAILLPQTDVQGASDLAERLRALFASLQVHVGGTALCVTASFGISSLNSRIKDTDDWLATADERLYEAKAGGRNRCCGGVNPQVQEWHRRAVL